MKYQIIALALALAGSANAAKVKKAPAPVTPPAPDPRDAKIAALSAQVEMLMRSQQEMLQKLDEVNSKFAGQADDMAAVSEAKATIPRVKDPEGKGGELNYGARWNNGPEWQTLDRNFRLHIGGQIQQDFVGFKQDPPLEVAPNAGLGNLQNGVFFRRSRIKLDGQAYGNVEWEADFEFANSTDVFYDDLWVGLTKIPYIGNARLGHIKVPQGIESVTSNRHFTFMERATIFDAFTQEYNPGLLIFRTANDQRSVYHLAIHRPEAAANGIDFGDGEAAVTARVNGLPLWKRDGKDMIHVGASYSLRNAENNGAGVDVVRFRARPEIREGALLPRFVDTGNIAADDQTVSGVEFVGTHNNLSLQAEYMEATAHDAVVGGLPRGDLNFNGYYAYLSWFLTGETRPYDRRIGRMSMIKPKKNYQFDHDVQGRRIPGHKGGSGAWEVALRHSMLDLNSKQIQAGTLDDWTLALHWYLNPNFKVQWNVIWADRNVPGATVDGETVCYGMRSTWAY